MVNIVSTIQNQIISKLKNAKALRYSDIRPDGLANDLFNYHLQFLVKKGYIKKEDNNYSLSDNGIKMVADFNPIVDNTGSNNLFKVNILTVLSRITNGKIEILNQVRKSNPSFGKVGVMGGVVQKGENIEKSATRKLKAETGLVADFKLLGIQRRIMYIKGELFSDVLFPIAYSDEFDGTLLETSAYGNNLWVGIDEAILNDSGKFDSIKSLPIVLKAIKDGNVLNMPFFYNEDTQNDLQ